MLREKMKIIKNIVPVKINPKAGFTITELLVVAAIVILLAGIAIPTISKASMRSKMLKDQNNLKQIGSTTLLYMREHYMRYPPMGSAAVPWTHKLAPYVVTGWKFDKNDSPLPNIFRCPRYPKDKHNDSTTPDGDGDYGANDRVLGNPGSNTPKDATVITNPQSLIFAANAGSGRKWAGALPKPVYRINSDKTITRFDKASTHRPRAIFGDYFNALFCDGHVRAVEKDEFKKNVETYMLPDKQK